MTKDQPVVLLVDNEATFLEIISMKLKVHKLETVMANNAIDGLKQAEVTQPNLVLSDLLMPPGPNGLEFAFALKRNPKTRHIKLAFLTSLGDPWRELAYSRDEVMATLGDVIFFDKCNDIDRIADHVAALLQEA